MLGLWNRVALRNPSLEPFLSRRRVAQQGSGSSLLRAVMQDNWQMVRDLPQGEHQSFWCAQFEGFLGSLQQSLSTLGMLSEDLQQQHTHITNALSAVRNFQRVDASQLIQCFDSWFNQKWFSVHENPRLAPSSQVIWSTYERWFAQVPFGDQDMTVPSSWVSDVIGASAGIHGAHIGSLMRFKLGAHDLSVCTGRWQGLARDRRVCSRCDLQQVEDEFHMVFECPFYDPQRESFAQLFSSFGGWDRCRQVAQPVGPDLCCFMQQKPRLVAAFIHACWLQRCSPIVAQLMMPEVEAAIEDSEEFLSVSSDSWFECEEESIESNLSP